MCQQCDLFSTFFRYFALLFENIKSDKSQTAVDITSIHGVCLWDI